MQHSRWLLGLLLAITAPCGFAQIGKNVMIKAGTPEGKALDAINAAGDPAEKLQLLEKFAAELAKGDLEIVADDLFVNYYLTAKNYDKAFEYGEKLWAVDPDNFQTGINLIRAAQEKGDAARLISYGEKTAAIVTRYKAQPPPTGKEADVWAQEKQRTLDDAKESIAYVEQSVFMTAYRTPKPADRAAFLARFAGTFPD